METKAIDWSRPQKIDDAMVAFPASVRGTLLPPMDEIPKEFKSWHNPCSKAVSTIFFKGGSLPRPVEGVDPEDAARHLRAVLGSFEPKHEHKIAGAAWLFSMWYGADAQVQTT